MRGFVSFLLDWIVPFSCVACGRSIEGEGERPTLDIAGAAAGTFDPGGLSYEPFAGVRMPARILCPDCWRSLERPGGDCALRAGGTEAPLVSSFYTNDALLAAVRFLKFSGGRSAAPPLAWWMAQTLRRSLEDRGGVRSARPLLVPVPLHRRRLRERGYNQALLLARGVARELGFPVESGTLARSRNTKSQSKLPQEERGRNVRGAFVLIRPDLIEGQTVVLVDDLVTTGETARSCLEAILGADPDQVIVLAAGRPRADRAGSRA